jgi:carboxypeptidase Taq
MSAIDDLRERAAELADLAALEMLATWDQLVMMPAQGAGARALALGTLARLAHDRAISEDIGSWLQEAEGSDLGDLDRDIVRVARRDWERARRVPPELAAERARAGADGQESWQRARAEDDFSVFSPALKRNLELARAYGQCLADGGGPYEALLQDYDFGLHTRELQELFGALAHDLPPLIDGAAAEPASGEMAIPEAAQRKAVRAMLRRIGVDDDGWRVDVSAHPFTSWMGRGDIRVTTRYTESGTESLLSSLHEYGHALYELQVDPQLERTNLGGGTSMSVHESQSKLWENHIGRDRAFAEVLADELASAGFDVTAGQLHAGMVSVRPSLIRVSADPATYPLHIVLRFELELALVEGDLAVDDLPGAWHEAMKRLLGLDVPSDALGCLQDIHWGAGSFGYFPSYALGCLIAAQLWETMAADIGPREDHLRRGDVSAIQRWLGVHIHSHGRRLDTIPLVQQATGAGLQTAPFMRYAGSLNAS